MIAINYLPYDLIKKRILENEKTMDKMLIDLRFSDSLKGLSKKEKYEKIKLKAAHIIEENKTYKNWSVEDVIVENAGKDVDLSDKERHRIFGHTQNEANLKVPVANFFKNQGYQVFEEVPIGKSRADILCYKRASFLTRREIIAIELKARTNEMRRALDQITDYQAGADCVYLATTAFCVLEYALKPPEVIDPKILEKKLSRIGVGLILVDYTEKTCEVLKEAYEGSHKHKETYEKIAEKCERNEWKPVR